MLFLLEFFLVLQNAHQIHHFAYHKFGFQFRLFASHIRQNLHPTSTTVAPYASMISQTMHT